MACYYCGAPGQQAHPVDLYQAVALAADPQGLVTAERLAQEWMMRLGLAKKSYGFVWHSLPRALLCKEAHGPSVQRYRYTHENIPDPLGLLFSMAWSEADWIPAHEQFRWGHPSDTPKPVTGPRGFSRDLFEEFLKQSRPLWRALFATGYMLDSLATERDDRNTLVMVAPALEA